jgi:hypothetical protein
VRGDEVERRRVDGVAVDLDQRAVVLEVLRHVGVAVQVAAVDAVALAAGVELVAAHARHVSASRTWIGTASSAGASTSGARLSRDRPRRRRLRRSARRPTSALPGLVLRQRATVGHPRRHSSPSRSTAIAASFSIDPLEEGSGTGHDQAPSG